MIFDVEPVANIPAVPINWKGLAIEAVEEHQGDQLLGKLVGPVVVRAVRDQGGEAIGLVPGPYQMIGGRFRCRVRRIWSVRGLFGEEPIRTERAVDLVGRDVKKAERLPSLIVQTGKISTCSFQENKGSANICFQKRRGVVNRPIDVGLRCKINDGGRLKIDQKRSDEGWIGNVPLDELGSARLER